MKKDGRYTCEPFEFPVASLDEVFVFHLEIVNLQDTFARGLMKMPISLLPAQVFLPTAVAKKPLLAQVM